MKTIKKFSVLLLFFVVGTALLLTGCSKAEKPSGVQALSAGEITYPIETDVTLTYWGEIASGVSANFPNLGDAPYGKAWVEKTGIKVNFLHPPTGGANEQFNLLIASGDMPDIMDRDWFNRYPGGPQKAISDGIILRLNDLIDKYAPNLKAVLATNPEWDRMVKTDEGDYYAFPFIRGDEKLCVWHGPILRKDWLDELGLSIPETYDEWHTVLTAFKNKKGASTPLSFIPVPENYDFLFGFGVDWTFYVADNGGVGYGPVENDYRDYLAMMTQWYKEGLLDPDFATLTSQQVNAKITSGLAGATCGGMGGGIGGWTNTGRATNPQYELTAAPTPVVRKGDKPSIINVDNQYTGGYSAAITISCKHPELAARLLDWNYSPEGKLFNNFGIEGISYTMVNGNPVYTDLVLKNPDGWSVAQGIAAHARAAYGGPFIQDVEYLEQYMVLPEQIKAPDIWKIDDPYKHKMPPITPTPEESREFARIMSEVITYVDEMRIKFILGTEPLSNWNTYVDTIKRMGIDRAIEIQNAALSRFSAR
jgi:putative aldouronate transport system substrate-binding protein